MLTFRETMGFLFIAFRLVAHGMMNLGNGAMAQPQPATCGIVGTAVIVVAEVTRQIAGFMALLDLGTGDK